MQKVLAAVVNWVGPYTYEEALATSKTDLSEGLYVAVGKKWHQFGKRVMYIGEAGNIYKRLTSHEILKKQKHKWQFWLGEIVNDVQRDDPHYRKKIRKRVEALHIYFVQPDMNTDGIDAPPTTAISIVNHWLKPDFKTHQLRKPDYNWPDLIDYRGRDQNTRLAWLSNHNGTVRYIKPSQFMKFAKLDENGTTG